MSTQPDFQAMIKQMGGTQAISRGIQDFTERVRHFDGRRAELTKEYPNKWVAMYEKEIVASSNSLEGLLTELDSCGVSKREAIIDFLNTEPQIFIL